MEHVKTIDTSERMKADAQIQEVQFSQLNPVNESIKDESKRNLDLILDILVPVSVELGHTTMLVKDILTLSQGSIVELDKMAGTPVLLFYRMVLPLGALLAALAVGLAATLAFAYFAVGHLNVMSAFLTAIVIGNGVNPGIVLLARTNEELGRGRDPRRSIRLAIAGAARGTLAASLTASIAYAALIVTDFRGFRHFGVIGGVGMVLCWLTAFSVMPAALFVLGRLGWLKPRRPSRFGDCLGQAGANAAAPRDQRGDDRDEHRARDHGPVRPAGSVRARLARPAVRWPGDPRTASRRCPDECAVRATRARRTILPARVRGARSRTRRSARHGAQRCALTAGKPNPAPPCVPDRVVAGTLESTLDNVPM